MSAVSVPRGGGKTTPRCACCRRDPAGDLVDVVLGGPVRDDCAEAGAIAVLSLRKAGLLGITADRGGKAA